MGVMDYVSSPDIAEKYGIPLRTIQHACATGQIKATRFGRMWLIDPEDAHTYAEKWSPHTRNGHEIITDE